MLAMAAIAVALAGTVEIEAGTYRPLYPADPDQPVVAVRRFAIDALPVTRAEFEDFVVEHPEWERGAPPAVMADPGYLASWEGPARAGGAADAPITEVSWFAARAYCEARGARLPTEDEWEYVARASPTARDASGDPAWLAEILSWYARSAARPEAVGQRPPNAWGVHDLHGLVWEWVEDYNNTFISEDRRDPSEGDAVRFCGQGALSATDVRDYATFMRLAFRSSLKGRYTARTLGFRCARDLESP